MKGGDSRQSFRDLNPPRVDRLSIADDPWDRPEPGGDPQGAGIGEVGQRPVEHLRIELVGLAVDVEKGAGKVRAQHRRPERDAGQEQVIDESVLGPAQGQWIEPRGGEKGRGVVRARMGRIEHQRRAEARRFDHLERRLEPAPAALLPVVHPVKPAAARRRGPWPGASS